MKTPFVRKTVNAFLDPDAPVVEVGTISEGMRDAMAGRDTPHAEAFRQVFVMTMHRMTRPITKGS